VLLSWVAVRRHGSILETPGEPSDSTLKERLYHAPIRARVSRLVFAYMGPPDKQPISVLDTFDLPVSARARAPPCGSAIAAGEGKQHGPGISPSSIPFPQRGFTDDLGALENGDWMKPRPAWSTRHAAARRPRWCPSPIYSPQYPPIPRRRPDGQTTSINRPRRRHGRPLDDTHTMQIGFYPAPRVETSARLSFGQTGPALCGAATYPGDYDAR